MSLIDLLVILLYLVLVAVAKINVSVLSVLGLVAVLIVERILIGERLPIRTP